MWIFKRNVHAVTIYTKKMHQRILECIIRAIQNLKQHNVPIALLFINYQRSYFVNCRIVVTDSMLFHGNEISVDDQLQILRFIIL